MSVQAHPRILRRRTHVREHSARRHIRRALVVLLVVAGIWAVAWTVQSPLFSVSGIHIEGARNARVEGILSAESVYPGRPLVLIRPGTVEAALREDPWVREASVWRRFPDRIEVTITERREVAAVSADSGFVTISDDGRIMRTVPGAPGLARVGAGVAFTSTGEVSAAMLGVAEFLASLPADLAARVFIGYSRGELFASLDEHQVRLGTANNMAAKAAALLAVLGDDRLAPSAAIDLIAPLRPAVSEPTADETPPS